MVADPARPDLESWVARYGPLSPSAAVVLALETCAAVARMPRAEVSAAIGSLDVSEIRRTDRGWCWMPTPTGQPLRAIRDADVVERVGVILFHALTGQHLTFPFPDEQALRATVRRLRPELSAQLSDLTVKCLRIRQGRRLTLSDLASRLHQALGVEAGQRSRRKLAGIAVGVAVAVLGLWGFGTRSDGEVRGSHGLTSDETILMDIGSEAAQANALVDEHTAAIQLYQQIGQVLGQRLTAQDPRIAWNQTHEAWVRMLAGDRLTTEQLLKDTPDWLARELGEHHPYTWTARLGLAAVLDARGARDAALRTRAESPLRELLARTGLEPGQFPDVPVPPGVRAHVAPAAPEREGFRRDGAGGFFVPLTSVQRMSAGRGGWRLYLSAEGSCRVSFVTGIDPRSISVAVEREESRDWALWVNGTVPRLAIRPKAGSTVGMSMTSDSTGAVRVSFSDGTTQAVRIDPAAAPSRPPYHLAFRGGGCALIWLDIPFPRSVLQQD